MTKKNDFSFLSKVFAVFAFLTLISSVALAQPDPRFDTFALTVTNQLIRFDARSPGTIQQTIPLTGLRPNEVLLAIDFRPATGFLYGLGSSNQIYIVNRNGAVTAVGPQFTPALEGTEFGLDFNPVVDRIRIVSNVGQNLRAHPDTGQIVGNDTRLTYLGFPVTTVVAAAYTNPDTDPATGTVLYVFERDEGLVGTQNPPNDGILNLVGPLGTGTLGTPSGFDIGLDFGGMPPFGYGAVTLPNGTSRLVRIALSNGAATDLGLIGNGTPIRGLALFKGGACY